MMAVGILASFKFGHAKKLYYGDQSPNLLSFRVYGSDLVSARFMDLAFARVWQLYKSKVFRRVNTAINLPKGSKLANMERSGVIICLN